MTMCAARIRTCDPISEYQCANKHCIDRLRVCDLTDDCGDKSDELGCRKLFISYVSKKSIIKLSIYIYLIFTINNFL